MRAWGVRDRGFKSPRAHFFFLLLKLEFTIIYMSLSSVFKLTKIKFIILAVTFSLATLYLTSVSACGTGGGPLPGDCIDFSPT